MAGRIDRELARMAKDIERKPEAVYKAVEKAFRRDGLRWKAAMIKRTGGPLYLGPGKPRRARVAARRGNAGLRGGFYAQVSGSHLDDLTLSKGNTRRHAVVHEFGTVGAGGTLPDIVPKRARALTVPLPDAMTPSGVPRRAKARDWPDTFILNTTNGKAFIVQSQGGSYDKLTFLYQLLRRVAIPPRLGMAKTHEKQAQKLGEEIFAFVKEALAA